MIVYLETSVLLRKVLGEPGPLNEWGDWTECYTSEITSLESLRTLDRLRLQGMLDDIEISEKLRHLREFLGATNLLALDKAVLDKASQNFPTIIGALDAIHLASSLLFKEEQKQSLVFLTHDARLSIAAQAMGFEVLGCDINR